MLLAHAQVMVLSVLRQRGLDTWTFMPVDVGPLVEFRKGRKVVVVNQMLLAELTLETFAAALNLAADAWSEQNYVAICPACRNRYYMNAEPHSGARYYCQADEAQLQYA